MFNFNRPRHISSTASRGARRRQTKKARSPERRRARFEFLEDRRVLAVLTVNSVGDVAADTSALTLRDAITLVNNSGDPTSLGQSTMPAAWASQISGNFGSNDTIEFDSSLAGTPVVLAQGELLINSPLTITGLPAAGTTIDGNNTSRILDITAAAGNVTVNRLTLTNEVDWNGSGAAIYSESTLTVNSSMIVGNHSDYGAAVFAAGDATISDSTIADNTGNGASAATLTLVNSTVAGNYNAFAAVSGVNVIADNSTIVANGGLGISATTLTSHSSIVAKNVYAPFGGGINYDLSVQSATLTDSLIGNAEGAIPEAPVGSPDANGNLVGGPIHGFVNPMLGSLDWNGGATQTMVPLPGSPVIGAGANPNNLATDQRGFARSVGGQTDIGAVEFQVLTPTLSVTDASGIYTGNSFPAVDAVAGGMGPLEPSLEGVTLSVNYYSGSTAAGAALAGAPSDPGTYTVQVAYPGSREYAPTMKSVTFSINALSITAVTSSAGESTSDYGENVIFTANVEAAAPGTGIPTGKVQFQIDGQNLGSPVTLDANDQASINTAAIPIGNHHVTAVYSGGANFLASTGVLPGTTTAFAGNGTSFYTLPGPAKAAVLNVPAGVAVDPSGDLFIADVNSNSIRKVDAKTGVISVVARAQFQVSDAFANGPWYVAGMVCDAAGDLYYSDPGSHVVEKLSPTGVVTTVAGIFGRSDGGDDDGGPATSATLSGPSGLALDPAGNLYIVDELSGVVRKVDTAGIISTVAGGGYNVTGNGDGGPATSASMFYPTGIAVNSAGDIFIADVFDQAVRKVDHATGIISTVFPGSASTTSYPDGLALDVAGNLYITDLGSNDIVELNSSGVATTVAGTSGSSGYSGDGGSAAAALLNAPTALATDAAGDLFIADLGNQVIREVNSAGTITTVAGGGILASLGNGGRATDAALPNNNYIVVDAAGDLFIANPTENAVREVTPDGIIHAFAGNGIAGYTGDGGAATAAELNAPNALAFDGAGDLLIADSGNNVVRMVTPSGVISTVTGASVSSIVAQTSAVDASGNQFSAPFNPGQYPNFDIISKTSPSLTVTKDATTTTVAPSAAAPVFGQPLTFTISVAAAAPGAGTPTGTVQLVVDGQNFGGPLTLNANDSASLTTAALTVGSHVITAVYSGDADFNTSTGNTGVLLHGTIKTVAGNGTQGDSGDGGPALKAQLNFGASTALPLGYTAVDAAGDLFISDTYNNVIRKVTPDGNISTVAGNGSAGYSGDIGLAINAQLNHPEGIAVDAAGDLFIVDSYNNAIREVTPNGVINTIAGGGAPGYSGDGGSALAAQFEYPEGIAVDAAGDLFIADWGNSVVREIDTQGNISTVAGNGTQGYSADGVQATAANLISPTSVAVDSAGDLFFTDLGNYDVREVRGGILSTVAGNGTPGDSGDGGLATAAQLNYPDSIALDAAGNLFIADTLENVIREVSAGIIYTVAGNGASGYSGDGQAATAAKLNYPDGIAVDAAGNLFFADTGNNVVREITPTLIVNQAGTTTTLTSSNASVPFGTSLTFTATVAVVAPGAGAPTGTVTFYDGTMQLATVALNAAGQATFTTSKLSVATHTITAIYIGDSNFLTSTSAVLNQAVLSAQQEAAAMTTQVQTLVASGALKSGNANSLIATLNAATASLNRGNTLVGVVQLGVFIAKVEVLALTRRLDATDAQTLIADATAAIVAAVNARLG